MFHRRPRTPSNAHLNTDPTPSAATAAAQAFLAHRASNAALSTAAAAAALRSHSTTPVSVAEVQTKRTAQRRQSVSSDNGYVAGPPWGASSGGGATLRRRGSSGSMTERSFRDPSPGRLAPRGIADPTIPPVPALPKQLPPQARSPIPASAVRPATAGGPMAPPIPDRSHRRASSIDQTGPSLLPRVASPPPAGAHNRGKSVDSGALASPGLLAAQRASYLASAPEQVPRPESRSSVNFSYPISPRSGTPMSDEALPGAGVAWEPQSPPRIRSPDPSSLRSGPRSTLSPATSDTERVPGPSKKKKNPSSMEASSTMPRETVNANSRPASSSGDLDLRGHYNTGTSLPLTHGQNTEIAPAKRKKKKQQQQEQQQQQFDATPTAAPTRRSASADLTSTGAYHSDLDTISEDGDVELDRPQRFKTRAGALLVKQPSVVREDRAREEEGEQSDQLRIAGANAPGMTVAAPGSKSSKSKPRMDGVLSQPSRLGGAVQHTRSASQPATGYSNPAAGASRMEPNEEPTRTASAGRGPRPQSMSPHRNAHFAKASPVSSPLAIKHEPPPRSLSPAKSALRKSPSPRPGSAASQVSSTGFAGQAQRGSETAGPLGAGELAHVDLGLTQRRKTSRVSFDEESVVIEDESTAALSPTHAGDGSTAPHRILKETLRGSGGGIDQWRDRGSRMSADPAEEDFSMPRQALPTFGSIRRQNDKDISDAFGSTAMGPASEVDTATRSRAPLEPSSDHAIGGLIARDLSIKPRPYPDSLEAANGAPLETLLASDAGNPQAPISGDAVPSIEFTQPTPSLEQPASMDHAGGLLVPSEHMTERLGRQDHRESDHVRLPSPTPALAGLAEPEPEEVARNHGRRSPVVGHVAETLLHQAEHPESDDSEETELSLYSDAAEDIALTEGDGFGSIDAVVDSPTVDSTPGLAITTPPESPTKMTSNGVRVMEKKPKTAINGAEPSEAANWDEVQRHWKEVNERQQRESKGAASVPAEIAPGSQPKPKAKKKRQGILANGGPETIQPQPTGLLGSHPAPAKGKGLGAPSVRPSNGRLKSSISPQPDSGAATAGRRARQSSLPAASGLRTGPQLDEPEPGRRLAKKTRPATSAAASPAPFAEAVRNEIHRMGADRPATAATTSHKKGKSITSLRRRDSDSSASSSSFRKTRPRSTASGAVSLRRTMRPESQPPPAPMSHSVQPSSFSVRSLSPTGSARKPMRTTLRGPQSRGTPSLRPMSADAAKAPSNFRSFGKASKAPSAPRGFGRKSRRASDSSDDGGRAPVFRSRYEDSSDDEEVGAKTAFTPVRGIPRRIGEEDEESSDLPDSSDNEARTARAKASQAKKPESGVLAAGTLRFDESAQEPSAKTQKDAGKEPKKRRSLFSAVLGRRKHHDQDDSSTSRPADTETSTPPNKVNGFARRAASASLGSPASPSGAGRPTLTKRDSSRVGSESWPITASSPPPPLPSSSALRSSSFADPSTTDDGKRPTTSDGVPRRFPWIHARRPDSGPRRVSNPVGGGGGGGGSAPVLTRDFALGDGAVKESTVPEQVNEEDEPDNVEVGEGGAAEDAPGDGGAMVAGASTTTPKKAEKHVAAVGRNGKKKKFGKLRRMLGIYD